MRLKISFRLQQAGSRRRRGRGEIEQGTERERDAASAGTAHVACDVQSNQLWQPRSRRFINSFPGTLCSPFPCRAKKRCLLAGAGRTRVEREQQQQQQHQQAQLIMYTLLCRVFVFVLVLVLVCVCVCVSVFAQP